MFEFVRGIAIGVLSLLLFTACGGGGETVEAGNGSAASAGGKFAGTYYYSMKKTPEQGMTLELRKDGVAVATRPGGRVQQGTYRVEGDKITVSLAGDGANLAYTVQDDGNLTTLFYGSETAVFVKQ